MIPLVTELTEPPVVGRFYRVPCIERDRAWWPVTGPRHSDAEYIGFDELHWHYDLRFLTDNQLDDICRRGRYQASHFEQLFGRHQLPDDEAAAVVTTTEGPAHIKLRVCVREQPPAWQAAADHTFLPVLEAAYADKRVTCGKCPHRGLPLSSLPREPGTDIVTCVGHGLRWDLSTGKLVRR